MSKNLTRKCLALGAVVALGSTLFAGTPAIAAPGITIAPAAGDSYSFISGERFDLKVFGNTEFTFASTTDLQWEVIKTAGEALNYLVANNASAVAEAGGTDATAADATVTIDGNASNSSGSTTAGGNRLGLKVASTLATTVKVRAYIEQNGTAGYQAGADLGSNQETVTFIKVASITPTVTITAPTEGETTLSAKVALTNVNQDQVVGDATNSAVAFNMTYADGTQLGALGTTYKIAASWDATDKVFKATSATINPALVKDKSVSVQALYKIGASAANHSVTDDKIGSAAIAAVTTRKVASIAADTVQSTTAALDGNADGTADVALNSSYKVYAVVKDAASAANNNTPQPVAGVAVTAAITVNAAVLAADDATTGNTNEEESVTVNGTKYTDATKLPGTGTYAKLALTSDAAGKVFVDITTLGFENGEDVIVTFSTSGLSDAVITTNNATRNYTASILNVNGGTVVTTDGAAASVQIQVIDQFGGAIADEYTARALFNAAISGYDDQATVASTTGSNTSAAIVGGKATLSITDNGTGLGVNTYDLDYIKRDGSGYTGSATDFADLKVKIVSAADAAAGAITLTATDNGTALSKNSAETAYVLGSVAGGSTAATLETVDFVNYDSRGVVGSGSTVTDGNKVQIFGIVKNTSSATVAAVVVPNASVTLAAKGLQFKVTVNSSVIWAKDSITFNANENGRFTVEAWSQLAGKQTVTVSSGTGSAKLEVLFGQPSEDSAKNLTIDAPANILPGRTLSVASLLTDKFGNGVKTTTGARLTVSYDGPGFVTATLPSDTDADGKLSFKVLLGAADTGSATVKVNYDLNGDGDTADFGDIAKVATINIGAAPVASATAAVSGSTGKFYVSATNAAAKKVVVKVAGKFFRSFTGTAAKKTVALKAPKGKHKVTVFVGGKLVTTKTITVK